jgi:putative flippase GtrA
MNASILLLIRNIVSESAFIISESIQSFFIKLLKFGLVGFSGLIVDFGVTYILKEKLKANKYLANGLGFCLAVVSNFILNKIWTFDDKSLAYFPQFLSFAAVAIGGLLINQAILFMLHERFKLNFYLAKLLAIGVVTVWNFGFSNFIVFSQ